MPDVPLIFSAPATRSVGPAGSRARAIHQIIGHFNDQVRPLTITLALILAVSVAPSPAGGEGPGSELLQRLNNEANALIDVAAKSPYGWGWPADEAPSPRPAKPVASDGAKVKQPKRAAAPRRAVKPAQVAGRSEIDVRQTAAAGLALLMSAEQTGDAALAKGATEACRALAAVQQSSGQFPRTGILSANAGGRDEPAVVPARAATCAAVGLLAAVVQGSEKPDPRFVCALTKAASWLAKQQTDAGAFPAGLVLSGSTTPSRVVRLDTPEYRDATTALLLAARALGEPAHARRADEAVNALLAMRVRAADEQSGVLWMPAYRLGGEPIPKSATDLPHALDTVAAQHAMQTLLAACLLAADPATPTPATKAAAEALVASAKQINGLPRKPGGVAWYRYYDLLTRAPAPDLEPQGALTSDDVFGSEDAAITSAKADVAVLADTIAAANRLAAAGLPSFVAESASEASLYSPSRRVSLMLCGLGNGSLAVAYPKTRADAEGYVASNEARWGVLEGLVPNETALKIDRLNTLILRAKLEGIR